MGGALSIVAGSENGQLTDVDYARDLFFVFLQATTCATLWLAVGLRIVTSPNPLAFQPIYFTYIFIYSRYNFGLHPSSSFQASPILFFQPNILLDQHCRNRMVERLVLQIRSLGQFRPILGQIKQPAVKTTNKNR